MMSRLVYAAWAVVALGMFDVASSRSDAQDASREPISPQITVTGEGAVSIPPDVLRIRAGVITDGKSAREVAEANAGAMTGVMAAIKSIGIPEKDVQTQRYIIHPVYGSGSLSGTSRRITGFRAVNTVVLTIRDAEKIQDSGKTADVIDRLTAAGANNFDGIEFTIADRSKALDAARADAVADARRKAELYARAAGVTLGRPIRIVEGATGPSSALGIVMGAAPAQTPIAAGETALRVSITASFELQR